MPIVLSEEELHRRSLCSMYDGRVVDSLKVPAERTFRWALRERHGGKIPSPSDLREHFTNGWSSTWNKPNKDLEYWKGPKAAAAFGRIVYGFLLKYEVIHPFEPYSLSLGGGSIRGENALVLWRKARHEPVPRIVDMRLRRPRDNRQPYYPVLAQWIAAREVVDTVDLGIVHLPLLWGEDWTTADINEPLARQWLNAIVKEAAENSLFPRVGTQCVTCSHPCKEVLRGPDGHSWD
jgi:hypothetical protein